MMSAEQLIKRAEAIALTQAHTSLSGCTPAQLHKAVAGAAMEALAPVWAKKEAARAASRQACYFSAEFLIGRLVFNNLCCMGLLEDVRRLLADRGVDLNSLEEIEDAALGNGGLGRLAACFLDSAVTHDVPLTGYGLRYRFGLFRQRFENGRQMEDSTRGSR